MEPICASNTMKAEPLQKDNESYYCPVDYPADFGSYDEAQCAFMRRIRPRTILQLCPMQPFLIAPDNSQCTLCSNASETSLNTNITYRAENFTLHSCDALSYRNETTATSTQTTTATSTQTTTATQACRERNIVSTTGSAQLGMHSTARIQRPPVR